MKYVPKKFDQKTFGFEDRSKNKEEEVLEV